MNWIIHHIDHRTFKRHKCTLLDRVKEYEKRTHPNNTQVCVRSKGVRYNREHIRDTHSARVLVDLGQRLSHMYSREKHSELHNPETHSDIVINIQYIQSELDINILLMQFTGSVWNVTGLKVFFCLCPHLSLYFSVIYRHSTLFEASIVQGSFLIWGSWALTVMTLHASDFFFFKCPPVYIGSTVNCKSRYADILLKDCWIDSSTNH